MNLRRGTRPATPAAALAAGLLALAAGLSGCGSTEDGTAEDTRATAAADAGENPGENTAPAAETGQTADSRPTQTAVSPAPDAPAASAAALESELGKLAGSDSFRDPAAVVQAFVSVGFPESAVEVSPDRTPTGLEVDSIQAAAVQDGKCVFGEVREGSASATVLPVLSDGRCFVGD